MRNRRHLLYIQGLRQPNVNYLQRAQSPFFFCKQIHHFQLNPNTFPVRSSWPNPKFKQQQKTTLKDRERQRERETERNERTLNRFKQIHDLIHRFSSI